MYRCPVLLMTGQRSAFNSATRAMHQVILRSCEDKAKVEFIEVAGVANILQEKVTVNVLQAICCLQTVA